MNRKKRNNLWKRWGYIFKGRTKYDDVIVFYYAENGEDASRVNANRKSARMRAAKPKACDTCFYKLIFLTTGDMLRDIENRCFRCSKQKWCVQTHPKTKRVVEILPHIKKRNMWLRDREQY